MARKRKLNAAGDGATSSPTGVAPSNEIIGGLWKGSATNLLKQRIDEANRSIADGILNGTVVIKLDPEQIEDEVGSDRVVDWTGDEEFRRLHRLIERQGQKAPIRVRPRDPDWVPETEELLEPKARFVVQSGRRRIEVCRRLKFKVMALVSTEMGDAILADLEERFHENTARASLNPFEELLSIGHIAQRRGDLTQSEVADHLQVPQGDVSLGLSCVELMDEILKAVDVTTTPKRAFRSIIPQLRANKDVDATGPSKGHDKGSKEGQFKSDKGSVEIKRTRNGLSLRVDSEVAVDEDLNELAKRVASIVLKG